MDISALFCSFRLAVCVTVVLLLICPFAAYFLTFSRFRGKIFLESVVALPLALPPTVLGFYFLVLFGRESSIGGFLNDTVGISILFSFQGLVLGSVVYSFPFMVRPLQTGFEAIAKEYYEIAYLSGASQLQIFWHVLLPLSWKHLLTGCLLSFAHTLGEFGLVMMIGGNIPNQTRTAALALYDAVQLADYQSAHILSAVLLIVCFALNLVIVLLQRRIFPSTTLTTSQ